MQRKPYSVILQKRKCKVRKGHGPQVLKVLRTLNIYDQKKKISLHHTIARMQYHRIKIQYFSHKIKKKCNSKFIKNHLRPLRKNAKIQRSTEWPHPSSESNNYQTKNAISRKVAFESWWKNNFHKKHDLNDLWAPRRGCGK